MAAALVCLLLCGALSTTYAGIDFIPHAIASLGDDLAAKATARRAAEASKSDVVREIAADSSGAQQQLNPVGAMPQPQDLVSEITDGVDADAPDAEDAGSNTPDADDAGNLAVERAALTKRRSRARLMSKMAGSRALSGRGSGVAGEPLGPDSEDSGSLAEEREVLMRGKAKARLSASMARSAAMAGHRSEPTETEAAPTPTNAKERRMQMLRQRAKAHSTRGRDAMSDPVQLPAEDAEERVETSIEVKPAAQVAEERLDALKSKAGMLAAKVKERKPLQDFMDNLPPATAVRRDDYFNHNNPEIVQAGKVMARTLDKASNESELKDINMNAPVKPPYAMPQQTKEKVVNVVPGMDVERAEVTYGQLKAQYEVEMARFKKEEIAAKAGEPSELAIHAQLREKYLQEIQRVPQTEEVKQDFEDDGSPLEVDLRHHKPQIHFKPGVPYSSLFTPAPTPNSQQTIKPSPSATNSTDEMYDGPLPTQDPTLKPQAPEVVLATPKPLATPTFLDHSAPTPPPPPEKSNVPVPFPPNYGGRQDEGGCFTTAGYNYCQVTGRCHRFDEPCPVPPHDPPIILDATGGTNPLAKPVPIPEPPIHLDATGGNPFSKPEPVPYTSDPPFTDASGGRANSFAKAAPIPLVLDGMGSNPFSKPDKNAPPPMMEGMGGNPMMDGMGGNPFSKQDKNAQPQPLVMDGMGGNPYFQPEKNAEPPIAEPPMVLDAMKKGNPFSKGDQVDFEKRILAQASNPSS